MGWVHITHPPHRRLTWRKLVFGAVNFTRLIGRNRNIVVLDVSEKLIVKL